MPTAENKEEYIEKWDIYISQLQILVLCNDRSLGQRVSNCIKELKILMRKVADTKYPDNPHEVPGC